MTRTSSLFILAAVVVGCGGESFVTGDGGGGGGDAGDAGDGGMSVEGGGGDAGGDGGGCSSGILCGGVCVNPMTDTNNCGACANKCQWGACTGGGCPLFALANSQAIGDAACLTIDANNVYFTTGKASGANGAVYKVPLAGAMSATAVAQNRDFPRGIASDGTNVFWSEGLGGAGSGIVKSPTNQNSPMSIISATTAPGAVALEGGRVFWTTLGGNMVNSAAVWVADQDGNNSRMLSIPAAPGHASGHHSLAIFNGFAYWTDGIGGTVNRVDANANMPSMPINVATNQTVPFNVAVANGTLFWTNPANGSANSGSVMRAALPSGMPATYAMSLTRPFDVASDGTNVYFSLSNANGAIVRGAIGGGNFRAIATPSAPGCIAVDQTSVYWLAGAPNNTGMVYKGPK